MPTYLLTSTSNNNLARYSDENSNSRFILTSGNSGTIKRLICMRKNTDVSPGDSLISTALESFPKSKVDFRFDFRGDSKENRKFTMMMACIHFCCPCFRWCREKDGSLEEREPLVRRNMSHDKMKEKFQSFRKNVLQNSLNDFDVAKEDIKDVTLFLPPTGIGNVDAQLSGYTTLYNDHLERWKNLKKLLIDFKKTPSIAEKSREPMTFRSALVVFHKICDEIKSANSDLHIRSVSEFCFLVDYKPANEAEDKSQKYAAILIFNQINRDLREFIERGPSLARLLKSIAGGVRFQEATTGKEAVQPGQDTKTEVDEETSGEPEDEDEEGGEGEVESPDTLTEGPTTSDQVPAANEDIHVGICVERENLDLSISNASLNAEDKAKVVKRYKHNLEMLGKGSSIVEVLDLAAKSLWQNIHDELADQDS